MLRRWRGEMGKVIQLSRTLRRRGQEARLDDADSDDTSRALHGVAYQLGRKKTSNTPLILFRGAEEVRARPFQSIPFRGDWAGTNVNTPRNFSHSCVCLDV